MLLPMRNSLQPNSATCLSFVLRVGRFSPYEVTGPDWSLLDRDVLGWIGSGGIDRELLLSLDEARRVVEPGAAEIAAGRATTEDCRNIRQAYAKMEVACRDPGAATQADKAFHLAILDATHNPVLRSFRTAVDAMLDAVFAATIPMLEPNLPNHEAVATAIEAGDPAAARAAMDRLLDRTRALIDVRP
jgi:GntR family galactonate operon transcriptional repressor